MALTKVHSRMIEGGSSSGTIEGDISVEDGAFSGSVGVGGATVEGYPLYVHGSIAQGSGSIFSFENVVIGNGALKKGETTIIDANRNATFVGLTANGLTYPTSDGTNGQVLTTNGSGTLSFTTVSGGGGGTYSPVCRFARLTMDSDTSILDDAWRVVTSFNTRDADSSTSNALTSTLADGKFIIPSGVDLVRIKASVNTSSASDQFIVKIVKNGTEDTIPTSQIDTSSTGGETGYAETGILSVSQNDYFQVYVYSGTDRTLTANNATWFEIEVLEGSMLDVTV